LSEMKILFIVWDIDYIDSVGLMQISALARQAGHTIGLGILSRENVMAIIQRDAPDVIAYSGSTGEHKYYIEFNERLKAAHPGVFTVMGGPHVTFFPETLRISTLDAICIGEGDEAFTELLAALENGHDITNIPNIVTRQGGNTDLRPLKEDLDSLPFPDRELFYTTTEMRGWPLKSFMASRGCPYYCTYCFNHVFRQMYHNKGRIVRRHSVDYIVEEVARVKEKYPLQVVKFYDDVFTYRSDDWLEEFAVKFRRRIGLPFHCLTRADLMTEDMARMLKAAGCHSISMSIEAGNERFRNEVLQRNMQENDIIRAFDICRRRGIHTFSNSILGLPRATLQNEIETIELNIRAGASYSEFPIFHPYPCTKLGDYCIKEGIYRPTYSELHMSYMNESPLTCFSESEKNVQRNLSALGPLMVWLPFTRKFIYRWLLPLPFNRFYFILYYLVKAYLNKSRIYPMKLGFRGFWKIAQKSWHLESFRKISEPANIIGHVKAEKAGS
jgi:anaerobic magnesium-protoporphyrin IX monomethyl ester cyclase